MPRLAFAPSRGNCHPCSGDEALGRLFEDGRQDVFELLAVRWLKHSDAGQVGRFGRWDRAGCVRSAALGLAGTGKQQPPCLSATSISPCRKRRRLSHPRLPMAAQAAG